MCCFSCLCSFSPPTVLRPSTQFHVFEITRQLPRFSMYVMGADPSVAPPTGRVTFSINDRSQRVNVTIYLQLPMNRWQKHEGMRTTFVMATY